MLNRSLNQRHLNVPHRQPQRQSQSSGLLRTGILISVLTALGCLVPVGLIQSQKAELREQAATAEAQLKTDPVTGLVSAIQTIGQNQNRLPWSVLPEAEASLLDAVQTSRERNRFQLQGAIHTVGFSPNGQTLAAAGETGVYLWDRTRATEQTLEGDGQTIGALNFSPDGSALFGNPADAYGTAQFWTLKPDSPYQAPQNSLSSAAFSADGQMIVSGSVNGRVRLWDQQGKPIAKLYPRLEGNVTSVAFDGTSIVTGNEVGKITLWNNKGNPIGTLWAGASIRSLQLDQGGQRIISQDLNRQQAFLWNRDLNRWSQFLLGETATVSAADLSADNQRVAKGNLNGTLEIAPLDPQNRAVPFQRFTGHKGAIQSVTFSPDQKTVVSGGEDGSVRLWDINDGTLISRYSLREWTNPSLIALSRNGEQIAVSDRTGKISLGRSDQSARMQLDNGIQPTRILYQADGNLAIQTHNHARNAVISLRNQDGQEQAKIVLPVGGPLKSLALSKSGNWLSLSQQGHLQYWNSQGQPMGAAVKVAASTGFVSFSPDGQQAISGGSENGSGQTCLWHLSRTGLKQQSCQEIASRSVAFSPDGQSAAIGLDNGNIGVWDLRRQQLTTWKSHSSPVTTIAFSPDGQRIASGNSQGWIRLNTRQGAAIGKPLAGHQTGLQALAFTSESLISLSQDGEVRIWQVNWQDWLKTACNRLQQHPVFTAPTTDAAKAAKATCQRNQSFSASPSNPVPPAPVPANADQTRLVVKLGERRVYVYRGKTVQATYPIAIGKSGWETPTGSFRVFSMIQNPGWTNPVTGSVLTQGQQTPLGSRWIGFWTDGINQVGFHATPERKSVGNAVSHGCLRLYEEDAQALYEQVKLGTVVTVEP